METIQSIPDLNSRDLVWTPTQKVIDDNVTILWDQPGKLPRLRVKLDMSDPNDQNIAVKASEKLNKYKVPEREIKEIWLLKAATWMSEYLGWSRRVAKDIKMPGEPNQEIYNNNKNSNDN